MATEAQIAANRINALKSTGPRTPDGKARSARNAVKWGLFSKQVVFTEQEAAERSELSLHIRSLLEPVGELEELSVDEVTANWFRVARCLKIDTCLFRAYSQFQGKPCGLGTAFAQAAQLDCFGKLSRYEQHLERKLALSLQRFQSVRSVRRSRREPAGADQSALVGPAPSNTASTAGSTQLVEAPGKALESATRPWREILVKMTAGWVAARLSRFRLFVP